MLFRLLFSLDGVIALVVLGFFVAGRGDGSVSRRTKAKGGSGLAEPAPQSVVGR